MFAFVNLAATYKPFNSIKSWNCNAVKCSCLQSNYRVRDFLHLCLWAKTLQRKLVALKMQTFMKVCNSTRLSRHFWLDWSPISPHGLLMMPFFAGKRGDPIYMAREWWESKIVALFSERCSACVWVTKPCHTLLASLH
jgi:hypothetical protein